MGRAHCNHALFNMITLKEAAVKYDISKSHLRLLCRQKRIPAQKIGRDWVIEEGVDFKKALENRPMVGKYLRKAKNNG